MQSKDPTSNPTDPATPPQTPITRRSVLKGSTAAMGAAATFAALGTNFAWAQVSEELKVGMIGCGGRAKGAAGDITEAGKILKQGVKIHCIADAFSKDNDKPSQDFISRHKVEKKNFFVGLDAYKEVLASDVELVIMATPPGFRPIHFEAAIDAGKHVFFEKPVASDIWGVKKVMAAGKKAVEKKLACVTGTQRRHQQNYIEPIEKIHAGAIGDVLHMSVYWNGDGIWHRPREAGMTDMEYQVHNWYHHIWLSGDQICEQHIHNLDIANWVMDSHPISALGMGGRQVRDRMGQPGEIWDHFAIEYEYPNGGRVLSQCRHWPKSDTNVSEFAIGSKGTFQGLDDRTILSITGGEKKTYKRDRAGYVQEHVDLINSIKDGKPLNEAQRVAESTLTAIIGRTSCYTGKKVKWDWALNESKQRLVPEEITRDAKPPEVKVPQPGEYPLI